MGENLLVLQGGGPTPVLNTSLFAAVDEARKSGKVGRIFGGRHGIEGLIQGDLVELTGVPQGELERLRRTPGASLGTTRVKPGGERFGRDSCDVEEAGRAAPAANRGERVAGGGACD